MLEGLKNVSEKTNATRYSRRQSYDTDDIFYCRRHFV